MISAFLALRWAMTIIEICSLIKFYEHMANNLAFQLEIQPNATIAEFIWTTLEGTNPVLAPGIQTLGAVIGLAATYRHPVLETT